MEDTTTSWSTETGMSLQMSYKFILGKFEYAYLVPPLIILQGKTFSEYLLTEKLEISLEFRNTVSVSLNLKKCIESL